MTEENVLLTQNLVPGVYQAIGTFPESDKAFLKKQDKYNCALSIGWNPVYENAQKTIEVFLIDDFKEDFYGELLSVQLTKFIRAEALFANFDSLILTIQCDIEAS